MGLSARSLRMSRRASAAAKPPSLEQVIDAWLIPSEVFTKHRCAGLRRGPDDLCYWHWHKCQAQLVIPDTLDVNDMRFGYPVVLTANGGTEDSTLRRFDVQSGSNRDAECLVACLEVEQIARLRLADLLAEQSTLKDG